MKKGMEGFLTALAVLTIGMLAFNMWAILAFKQRVFLEKGPLTTLGIVILAGFLVVLIFNLLALVWLMRRILSEGKRPFHVGALVLNLVCLAMMAGEKVMVDEIAREYRLAGWEAAEEWVILYGCLGIQMIFCLLMFFHLARLLVRE